ncbi:unnamed protein product [Calypogeia fissa]
MISCWAKQQSRQIPPPPRELELKRKPRSQSDISLPSKQKPRSQLDVSGPSKRQKVDAVEDVDQDIVEPMEAAGEADYATTSNETNNYLRQPPDAREDSEEANASDRSDSSPAASHSNNAAEDASSDGSEEASSNDSGSE